MAAFLIVDAVGRRTLAIWGALAMGVPYVVIAALYGLYSDNWPVHPAAGWACVAMACELPGAPQAPIANEGRH